MERETVIAALTSLGLWAMFGLTMLVGCGLS
jgi:hypothetical protein